MEIWFDPLDPNPDGDSFDDSTRSGMPSLSESSPINCDGIVTLPPEAPVFNYFTI